MASKACWQLALKDQMTTAREQAEPNSLSLSLRYIFSTASAAAAAAIKSTQEGTWRVDEQASNNNKSVDWIKLSAPALSNGAHHWLKQFQILNSILRRCIEGLQHFPSSALPLERRRRWR